MAGTDGAGVKARVCVRRDFYPCNLKPTKAEEADYRRRSKGFDDTQRAHVKRIGKYLGARLYLEAKQPLKISVIVALAALAVYAILILATANMPFTKVFLLGMQGASGKWIITPGWQGVLLLGLQGTLGTMAATWMVIAKNRMAAKIDEELYKEWTKGVDLRNDEVESVVMPRYHKKCPYDPLEKEFELVIGEYYDNPGHKFGPLAEWYTVPFKGLATGGTAVFGVTGSGKTASVLKNFMRQYFSWYATTDYDPKGKGEEKLAGLVLDPKGSLCSDLSDALKAAGLDPVLDKLGAQDLTRDRVELSPIPYQLQVDALVGKYDKAIEDRKRRIAFLEEGKPEGYAAEVAKHVLDIKTVERDRKELQSRAKKGLEVPFDMAVFESYRGRADDYIELGFDEFKVKTIFGTLDKIQEAKNRMLDVREVRFSAEDFESFDSHYVPSKPAIRKGLLELMVSVNNFVAAMFVASARRESLMRQYKEASLSPEPFRLRRENGKAQDAAKEAPKEGQAEEKVTEGFVYGAVGYQGDLNDMDAYANMRQMVRVIAPTKERPGEEVLAYRLRWLARESRLAVYGKNLKAVSEQMVDCGIRVLMTCGNDPKLSAFAREVISFAKLAASPMSNLLGPDSMVVDAKGIPQQSPSKLLTENLDRVKTHVPPDVLEDINRAAYHTLTVHRSDFPSPRPVDRATEKKMGNSFAATDPFVDCVEEIGTLRGMERKVARKIRAVLAKSGVIDAFREDAAQRLRNKVLTGFGAGLMSHEEEVAKLNRFLGQIEGFIRDDVEALCANHLVSVMAAEIAAFPSDWAYRTPDLGEVCRAYTLSRLHVDTDEAAGDTIKECFDRTAKKLRLLKGWEPRPKTLGSGALHACLRARYASGVILEVLREIARNVGAPGLAVERLMQSYVSDTLVNGFISTVEGKLIGEGLLMEALTDSETGLGLRKDIQELWHAGRGVMGRIGGLMDGMHPEAMRDRLAASLMGRDKESVSPPEEELLFDPYPYMSFWMGLPDADDVCPAAAASWDRPWGAVLMKRLSLALLAAPQDVQVWQGFKDMVEKYSDYHQQTLNMYEAYVAPNSGHRTKGPFMFNPLYLPGLDVANIAKTFVTAVFAATSKGGKSDPFWENASNSLVTNLLTATVIAYGYTTFPILSELIANKERLKKLMDNLSDIQKRPDCPAATLQDIQNVLGWYNGQWETPGANQGETKANIIATLSVTTQAFLAPAYRLAFAPEREEDISFPGWGWIFKHGKVVGVNLPIEKHPAVAQVVLPLLNKSFQKYVQLRDQQRIFAKSLMSDHGRSKITLIDAARQEVIGQIREKKAWHDVLADLFKQDDYRVDRSVSYTLCHPATQDQADFSVINLMLTHGSVGSSNGRIALDKFLAFLVGLTGKFPYKGYEWFKVDDGCRGAWNAGVMVGKCAASSNHFGLPSWSRVTLEEILDILKIQPLGAEAVTEMSHDLLSRKILPELQNAVGERWREVGFDWDNGQHLINAYLGVCLSLAEIGEYDGEALRNIGLMGGPGALLDLVRKLPMMTVMLQKDVFPIKVMERLRQDYEVCRAELNELPGQEGLSLIQRVKDYTAQIRGIEDELAALPNTERWIVWMVDECHFYLEGESDTQYASVSRSARALNCIATQSPASLYSRMEEKVCDALLANFPNRVILRQADFEEAETCANLLGGKKKMKSVERSLSHSFEEMASGGSDFGGRGKSSGGSVSYSMKETEEYIVNPNLLVEIPALQAFALTWDGGKMKEPRRVYMKPDFLFMSKEIRSYPPGKVERIPELPDVYLKGEDLFAMTVPRLMQLKVIDPSK